MKHTRLDIYKDYPNSAIDQAINEWIHKDTHRQILHYKLVDGKTFEQIAEIMDMSPKGVQNIVYDAEYALFSHLKIIYHP